MVHRKNKLIIFILIISVIILARIILFELNNMEQIEVKHSREEILQIAMEKKLLAEETVTLDNSEIEITESNEIKLNEYSGYADCLIIPEFIEDKKIETINTEAFENAQDLEIIKVSRKINEEIEIPNFEMDNSLSDGEYIAYTSQKEYSNEYEEYIENRINNEESESAKDENLPLKFAGATRIVSASGNKLVSDSFHHFYGKTETSESDFIGKYVSYTPNVSTYNLTSSISGYSSNQNVTTDTTLKWRILDTHMVVISERPTGGIRYAGANGYNNIAKSIKDICMNNYSSNLLAAYPTNLHIGELYTFSSGGTIRSTRYTVSGNYTVPKFYLSNKNVCPDGYENDFYSGTGTLPSNEQLYIVDNAYPEGFDAVTSQELELIKSSTPAWVVGRYVGYNESSKYLDFGGAYLDSNGKMATTTFLRSNGNNGSTTPYTSSAIAIRPVIHMLSRPVVVVGQTGSGTASDPYSLKGLIDESTCKIDYSSYSATYDGTEKKPAITVNNHGDLTENVQYKLTYTDNINAGTAKITIEGIGLYTGTSEKTFTIYGRSIHNATVTLEQDTYLYDGTEKKPAVTVKDGTVKLIEGTDYEVSYEDNTEAGSAKVKITGIGNYLYTKTETFTIQQSVSDFDVEIPTYITYTYDGTAKEPEVINVMKDFIFLTKDTDYTVSYKNNINAGTPTSPTPPTIVITGIGDYSGTKEVTFTINPRNITYTDITLSQDLYIYDEQTKQPGITVKDGTTTLTNNTDYEVAYSNNIDVGTATVTVTGKGNYSGTKTANFTISAKDMSGGTGGTSGFDITLSQDTYPYDGNAKEPIATVKDGTKILTLNTDYEITYSDNTEVGTAKVVVTGKGNYSGSKTVNFTIYGMSADGFDITLSQTSYEYDGTAKTPDVTVKNGNEVLVNGTDYTVSYEENTDAGTAKVIVTGIGNYSGNKTVNYVINAKNIEGDSGLNITLTPNMCEYDGNAKEPTVNVKYRTQTLVLGTDYNVVYTDNIEVGTAKAIINGINNYNGSAVATFDIFAKNISASNGFTIALSKTSYEYDGTAKTPTVTAKDVTKTLTQGADYEVAYINNIEVGTATATVTGKGNYSGTKSVNFAITAININNMGGTNSFNVTLSQNTYTYDGLTKEPGVTVSYKGNILVNGTDYMISYSNNTNAGTAKVAITGKGNYSGTIEKTFTIGKGMPTYTVPTGLSALYYSTLGDVNLPEGFTWEDNLNTKVGNVGENTFKCTYTPKDTANYNIITGIDVKIRVYEELDHKINGYKPKEVNGETYLEGIKENTTIKEIKDKITTNGEIKVYDGDNEVTDDNTKAKTGMRMEITRGNEKVIYILVVTGDVNGDGKVNGSDLLKLARYLIDLENDLKTANLLAGNVYKDDGKGNELNSMDILKFARVLAEIENFD